MALDIFSKIFGGKKSEAQSISQPIDVTPPEYAALRAPASTAITGLIGTGGPQYQGPLVAGITGAETGVLGQLGGMTGPGTTRAGYLEDVLGGKYLGAGNPFLDAFIKAAQRPTLEGLEEALGRTLPGRFTLAGHNVGPQGSSAFNRAAALATGRTAQALGDIASNIAFGAYEGERGRQQQAVGLSQQEVDATIKNLQAQGLPRMIADLGIERGLALFQDRTSKLLEILKLAGALGAPVNVQKTVTTSTGEETPGILAGLTNALKGGPNAAFKLPG